MGWRVLPRALREQRFRAHQLDGGLLADPAYRARLEAMKPEEVGQCLVCATDAATVDYLQRLLEFSREQAALARAPAGARGLCRNRSKGVDARQSRCGPDVAVTKGLAYII
ncbi:MAG: hypothetical protein NTX53_02365 [candidate division WOR-3 bacterium]|nr:hypothetical protein [candidate division WOR-3 bacterium]